MRLTVNHIKRFRSSTTMRLVVRIKPGGIEEVRYFESTRSRIWQIFDGVGGGRSLRYFQDIKARCRVLANYFTTLLSNRYWNARRRKVDIES